MIASERLILLFHHRWAVPVLGELHRGRGARLVVLLNRLGASQGALRRALDHLIEQGWVRGNPGRGHPLRPEYILAGAGRRLGEVSSRLMDELDSRELRDTGLMKWSMPVLRAIGAGAERFAQISRRLDGLTDRSLAIALRELAGAGLISREVVDGTPPATRYVVLSAGRDLAEILAEL